MFNPFLAILIIMFCLQWLLVKYAENDRFLQCGIGNLGQGLFALLFWGRKSTSHRGMWSRQGG